MVITHMMKLEPMQKVNYGKKIVPKIEEEMEVNDIDLTFAIQGNSILISGEFIVSGEKD